MTTAVHPENGAFFDLSARTKLRVTVSDRLRYLNGQISNDLRKASESAAIHACLLTAKGRINADVFIAVDGDSFLIDSDPDLRDQLAARLERYVIADDVQIEDVTGQFGLFHVLGGNAPQVSRGRAVAAERYGVAGVDLWVAHEQHDAFAQQLHAIVPFCDEEAAETFRIERGIPRWGRELSEDIIPTEANLESSSIDYAKGCYIGQEVISRIKMSGQTNKRLCGLITTSDVPVQAGARLFAVDADAKEIGWGTIATSSERIGAQNAFGVIRRGNQATGTAMYSNAEGKEPTRQEGAVLPFV